VKVRSSADASFMSPFGVASSSSAGRAALTEEAFHQVISLERKRSERSRKSFVLMLADLCETSLAENCEEVLISAINLLARSTRGTDIAGWYKNGASLGVLFTETGSVDGGLASLNRRITDVLRSNLPVAQFSRLEISFHVFPEDWNPSDGERPSNPTLYPDVTGRDGDRKTFRAIKRMMDIAGGTVLLALFSPIFLVIAIAIKATSKGPVFFRQSRSGLHGTPFAMLKFRSMYADSDSHQHQEYVRQLIAGVARTNPSTTDGHGVYKLTSDSRVTAVGAWLRRSSLDELPQLINVVKGEMSLVGPRPPIHYEVEEYELWHRRRLIEAKPGITGLWQVAGRNRIPFDEMVRLDLKYAQSWSPWLDLKILLRTPKAVLEGAH
jgi:lipopolysaccharide/colanic/teichoic acid biosynthesis glycosyltransferase